MFSVSGSLKYELVSAQRDRKTAAQQGFEVLL